MGVLSCFIHYVMISGIKAHKYSPPAANAATALTTIIAIAAALYAALPVCLYRLSKSSNSVGVGFVVFFDGAVKALYKANTPNTPAQIPTAMVIM